jgi:glycosyltransferase involved in cell wall biosynthesis
LLVCGFVPYDDRELDLVFGWARRPGSLTFYNTSYATIDMNIALVFSSFSPYHYARALALSRACQGKGFRLVGAAMTAPGFSHQWTPTTDLSIDVLCRRGSDGDVSLTELLSAWTRFLAKYRPAVVLVAGYWPASITLLSLLALAKRIPRILMTESHAATAKQKGVITALAKRLIVRSFSAAIVGGKPHAEYLMSLGFDPTYIRDGYDCVDNEYFEREAAAVRASSQEFRSRYDLPKEFFLTVARLVPKKNIGNLINAYSQYCNQVPGKAFDLVIVGEGELASSLRAQCASLGHPVRDVSLRSFAAESALPQPQEISEKPTVHFYGSRKINETPIFFALARAFVLPSIEEEWGLVVNEAMASGCPVILSERAGCARDLVPPTVNHDHPHTYASKLYSTGLLIDPTSAEDLIHGLSLMTSSPELRASLAVKAQGIVKQYSPTRFADHAIQLIELLCCKPL